MLGSTIKAGKNVAQKVASGRPLHLDFIAQSPLQDRTTEDPVRPEHWSN
jgi:hypothetical protein